MEQYQSLNQFQWAAWCLCLWKVITSDMYIECANDTQKRTKVKIVVNPDVQEFIKEVRSICADKGILGFTDSEVMSSLCLLCVQIANNAI